MKSPVVLSLVMTVTLAAACADMGSLGGSRYGESSSAATVSQAERSGKITDLEIVQVDDEYRLGVGTVVGAVAGGLLGSQIGKGRGSTVGAVAGAAAGAAAGTAVESKMKKHDAQRITVQLKSGGYVTIVQPVDNRLRNGMNVWVEGSGDSARVVPR